MNGKSFKKWKRIGETFLEFSNIKIWQLMGWGGSESFSVSIKSLIVPTVQADAVPGLGQGCSRPSQTELPTALTSQ
jgi:hypothetical protein